MLPQGGSAGVLVVAPLGSSFHLWMVFGVSQWQQLRVHKYTRVNYELKVIQQTCVNVVINYFHTFISYRHLLLC